MTSDKKQLDTEQKEENLFDSEPSDVTAESDQDTDSGTGQPESKPSEGGEEPLNLPDEEVQISKAEFERQNQIEANAIKILRGEKSLDDLEGDTQWLYLPVKNLLDTMNKAPEIEQLVEKKMAEKEDSKEFDTLKKQLNSISLNSTQREELQTEYKDLRSAGLSKSKALSKAIKMAGVKFDTSMDELKRNMALPKSGNYRTEDDSTDLSDFEKVAQIKDPAKRLKAMEAIREGKHTA